MHPLGLYLAVTDSQREYRSSADEDRRAALARVDAPPNAKPDSLSRIGRLAAIVRRRVMRTAGA